MRRISNDLHVASVVRKVYEDAVRLDWEHCTHREHTEQYARWLNDPMVGGVLSQWMAPEDQRVWLKDGPLKEFSRALAGEGPFALYMNAHPRSPSEILLRALGGDWEVVLGSCTVKPLQCDARRGAQLVRIYWGPARDFKHLLWAALEQGYATPNRSHHVVVFDSATRPLTAPERQKLIAIAERCGLLFSLIRL